MFPSAFLLFSHVFHRAVHLLSGLLPLIPCHDPSSLTLRVTAATVSTIEGVALSNTLLHGLFLIVPFSLSFALDSLIDGER